GVVEVAEGEGVVQRAVLGEALPVVAALHPVEQDEPAVVGAVEEVAVAVEGEPPGVAAALAEQLEGPRQRVEGAYPRLEHDTPYPGGHGAALTAVEPAVRPPGERVGDGVGVLHAEAAQEDVRIIVGDIVAVTVGVEEEVGRLEDEDAAVAEGEAGSEV